MRLWQAGRTGALAVIVAGLSACAEDPLYTICTVRDGAGHVYQDKDMDPVAAEQTALSNCSFTAADPNTCMSTGCQGVR